MATNIIDFFDPHNIEHIKAYRHLCEKGRWPNWVTDQTTGQPPALWQVSVIVKMADAWVEEKLKEEK